ncbi:unnamed protein product [Rangifer tarandus platyrhynchus]|uniref:Uncharacterized protein n=1 Tax=Rangifer tarandus platyrhynchus TaxID=3082113 RepID=A0AC59YCW4_RANTA
MVFEFGASECNHLSSSLYYSSLDVKLNRLFRQHYFYPVSKSRRENSLSPLSGCSYPFRSRSGGPHTAIAGTEARLQRGAAGWAWRTPTPSDSSVTSDAVAVSRGGESLPRSQPFQMGLLFLSVSWGSLGKWRPR